MQDDLKERLRRIVKKPYSAKRGPPPCELQMLDRIAALTAENERLREALAAYTEYCGICHGRGSFIEEDAVTGADLWRDCPGCTPARAALGESHD